jgi:hypothetical protein
MNRAIRGLVFFGVFIMFGAGAYSQAPAMNKILDNDLSQFWSSYAQEKIYVHTDKTTYTTREICWYRIYYVDAFTNQPATMSKIAYVEILDKNNHSVLQQMISLKEGQSSGSLVIPINIASGTYTFRAYTNWMKNFGPEYFFQKSIRIINPRKLQADSTVKKINRYDVQFFPEGGNLVQQIETRVGFRITDDYGRGLACEGSILNTHGDTVLRFRPLHKGLGNFTFTPVAGQSYRAIVHFPNGDSVFKELPAIYPEGMVMNLTRKDSSVITVLVRSSPGLESREIYLMVHGSRGAMPVKTGKLTGQSASFMIDLRDLNDGISQFTVFSQNGMPVCERLYFKYPQSQLLIAAQTEPEYNTRKKINIDLLTREMSGNAVSADMSLSVYHIDSLQNADENDIRSYLYLSAEIGSVESPSFYFEGDGKSREADMENLMMTHGWRRFNWNDIVQKNTADIQFAPEYNGHIIHGKVVTNRSGAVVPLTDAYLSIPSTHTQYRSTTSDSAGRVKFEMPEFYGSQEIIVQTNPNTDSTDHVEIDIPYSQKFSESRPGEFYIPSLNSPTLLEKAIQAQVQQVYSGPRLNESVTQNVDTTPFYVVPDEKYLLDDYTRFQTMEEVFREYIHSVDVTRRKDKFEIYAFEKSKKIFSDPPLILIDGVRFFNTNELMEQNPMKIRRIDLVTSRYGLGYQTYEGIVNLTTYHGDLDGIELDPHALVLDYPAIPPERIFFAPQYETEEQVSSRMPDYRSLLFWTPQIKPDIHGKKQVSFYSSDVTGKYAVVVQGLTQKGEPGSTVIFFDVKK